MFSPAIVENDTFLDMPLSTQALYFHLGMNADDDGFVSPKRVMRMIGANNDDLQILIAKRYVLAFPSGVVVMKHWTLNNFIRGDRYTKTTYTAELDKLTKNEYGAYTEVDRITTVAHELTEVVDQRYTTGIPNDIPTVDPGKVRLDKVSIVSKDTIGGLDKKVERVSTKTIDAMFEYWEATVGYAITGDPKKMRQYASKLYKEHTKEEIAEAIHVAARASTEQFAPRVANFVQLYYKWDELKLWDKRQVRGNTNRVVKI